MPPATLGSRQDRPYNPSHRSPIAPDTTKSKNPPLTPYLNRQFSFPWSSASPTTPGKRQPPMTKSTPDERQNRFACFGNNTSLFAERSFFAAILPRLRAGQTRTNWAISREAIPQKPKTYLIVVSASRARSCFGPLWRRGHTTKLQVVRVKVKNLEIVENSEFPALAVYLQSLIIFLERVYVIVPRNILNPTARLRLEWCGSALS